MLIPVTYMSGAGNTFSVIDNRKINLPTHYVAKNTPKLCKNALPNGTSTEGLMLINSSENISEEFIVDFFNPDGSTSMMCGNGARCAIRFATDNHFYTSINQECSFRMAGSIYKGHINGKIPTVIFPPPVNIKQNLTIDVHSIELTVDYFNVGSDHVVIELDYLLKTFSNISEEEVFVSIVPFIRHHKIFEKGANVNVCKLADNTIALRTYERGVEGITGACGTGAIATALHYYLHSKTLEHVIIPPSNNALTVEIQTSKNIIKSIDLTGNAEYIGYSEITIE